jgi:dimethylglycine dehydrogenase
MTLAPMLNNAGRIVGDLSLAALADDRFLIVGSGFAEAFHLRWFAGANPPADVFVRAASSTLAGFAVAGPNARALMQRLTRVDLSTKAFRFFDVIETAVGMSPAILSRSGFTGELGYEIWVTPDYLLSLHEDLREAGKDLGLVHFGGRALSSLRLEKGYGSFNKDFRPDYSVAETGLDRFVDFAKPEFIGRDAALAERQHGPRRKFVVFEVDADDADVVGYESVMRDGKPVGYVTSGAYGHWIGKSLAAGYVPAELAQDGAVFGIDILGRDCAAILRRDALHDPKGARLRA